MVFKNGIIDIKAAGYNGAHKVNFFKDTLKKSFVLFLYKIRIIFGMGKTDGWNLL